MTHMTLSPDCGQYGNNWSVEAWDIHCLRWEDAAPEGFTYHIIHNEGEDDYMLVRRYWGEDSLPEIPEVEELGSARWPDVVAAYAAVCQMDAPPEVS